jgi:hypothetical protein
MIQELPNTVIQLAGFLGMLVIFYVFYQIIKRLHVFPKENIERLANKLIFIAPIFALILVWLVLPPSTEPKPQCAECETEIVSYIQNRSKLIKCVETGSSAYYYLKGTDTFEGAEKLETIQLKGRIEKAKTSLTEVIEKFNLEPCL